MDLVMLAVIVIVLFIVVAIISKVAKSSKSTNKNTKRSRQDYIGDSHLYVRIGYKIIARYGNGVVVTPSARVLGYYDKDGHLFDSNRKVIGECSNGCIESYIGNSTLGTYSAGDIALHGNYPLCEYNSGNPEDAFGAVTAVIVLLVIEQQKEISDIENL